MHDKKQVVLLRDIGVDFLVLRKGSEVEICDTGCRTFFKSAEGVELSIENNKLNKITNGDTWYATKKDIETCINNGSSLNILTKEGVYSYTVEDMDFADGGITYLYMKLKIDKKVESE